MPEKFPYNLEKAQDEAIKMQKKIESGEVKNYREAEKNIENEIEREEVKIKLIKALATGDNDEILDIKRRFFEQIDLSLDSEIQQAAIKGMSRWLVLEESDNAYEILKELSLSNDVFLLAVKEAIPKILSEGLISTAIKLKEKYVLPEEMSQQAAKQGMINRLSRGRIDNAIKIKEVFALPEEIIKDSEIQQAAKQGMIKLLLGGWITTAIEIKEKFVSSIDPQEIIHKVPKLEKILKKIQKLSPEIHNSIIESADAIIYLCKFQNNSEKFIRGIKENPFFLDAIKENLRFSLKLITKYSQFDELSKDNIQFIFNAKKEILMNDPEIDVESVKFRQAMQERLSEINNPEILKGLEKYGINIDQWLNYSETQYFNLESSGSHLAFSETVSAPINRIKETLDSYAHTLKEVLKQYCPELSEFRIPLEDAKEIEAKIGEMQSELEKAKTEGNEQKVKGIGKGIEGLKKKLENIKTVALWDKLLGDISAFQQLKNDVFQAQENLIKAENDLQEKLSGKMPSGRMIQELKEKISKSKEELRSKFGVLEKRIDYFKDHLLTTISSSLGDATTGALMQEIQTNLAEQFDHYDEDRSTLSNLFSEKTDRGKGKMENQPILLDMHLRETSQRFFERYQNELEQMGVKMLEEALVPDYYDEGEDSLYKVYQITP